MEIVPDCCLDALARYLKLQNEAYDWSICGKILGPPLGRTRSVKDCKTRSMHTV